MSEIASDYLNNEDDLSGAGRKIELKDNLVVEFNNKASQVNPALRMLVLNNEDDLSGAGRQIELKDNLVVEFNNKASQVNPAFRMLVLALLLQ